MDMTSISTFGEHRDLFQQKTNGILSRTKSAGASSTKSNHKNNKYSLTNNASNHSGLINWLINYFLFELI